DADVLFEHGRRVELGLVPIRNLDITRLCQRRDDLGRDGVDLPWIQSHSRGTVGAATVTCKARSTFSCSLFQRCARSPFWSELPKRPSSSPQIVTSFMRAKRRDHRYSRRELRVGSTHSPAARG